MLKLIFYVTLTIIMCYSVYIAFGQGQPKPMPTEFIVESTDQMIQAQARGLTCLHSLETPSQYVCGENDR